MKGTPFACTLHMPICVGQVWWTNDGAVWTCANSTAAFSGRYTFVLLVFSGQMWLFGGHFSASYLQDVWGSTDGVLWVAQAPLPATLSSFAAVVLNSSILTTGYVSTEFKTVGVFPVRRPASAQMFGGF